MIEGNKVVLKCLYTVESVVSYTWQKDGGALPVGVDVSTSPLLTVAYADHLKHTGVYVCMVELQDGQLLESEPFNLTVQCKYSLHLLMWSSFISCFKNRESVK